MVTSELREHLMHLPVLKGPLRLLVGRLERVDLTTLTESDLSEHCAKAKVGEWDMRAILIAFRTFRGVTWAPGLTGLYSVDDVVHRLCCGTKDCTRCSEMASRVALDPELQARLAHAARQVVAVLS